jgi:5-methylcytosine-specific restriction enzyme A
MRKRAHPFYSTHAWRVVRKRVLDRDGYRCTWCGADVRARGAARVDHIKTLREAWALRLALDNLRTLCVRCDNQRHIEKMRGASAVFGCGPDGHPRDPSHWWNT